MISTDYEIIQIVKQTLLSVLQTQKKLYRKLEFHSVSLLVKGLLKQIQYKSDLIRHFVVVSHQTN